MKPPKIESKRKVGDQVRVNAGGRSQQATVTRVFGIWFDVQTDDGQVVRDILDEESR